MIPISDKIICTHRSGDNTYSNVFILTPRYSKSVTTYKGLIKEAKKDFPFLTDDDIECCMVTESTSCKNFPLVRFSIPNVNHPAAYRHVSAINFRTS